MYVFIDKTDYKKKDRSGVLMASLLLFLSINNHYRLTKENRLEDIKKSFTDKTFREKLLKEYHL